MSELLGEARVVIRPDTTQFRSVLEAEIAAATRKPIVVPVTAAVTATTTGAGAITAQTRAEQEAVGVKRALITATQAQTTATSQLARIQTLTAKSASDLAAAELKTITSATAAGAAQLRAAAAVRSAANAQEALQIALARGNVQLVQAAALTALLSKAQAEEALSALSATKAQNAHAASLANVQKAGIASSAGLIGLRGAVLTAGAGFIAATVAFQAAIQSIQSAAQLEETLNVFQVTAGATADEMERVSEAAAALGRDLTLPGVTAQDAATAMTTLSKAGLDVQQSIDGARGALSLAVAAETDFANAADLIANSLNTFRLSGRDAASVANLLAASSNEAQGSIEDMGLALRQAGAVAQLAGISIEDTLTVLTQLAKAGLSGSDAGTSFRTALVRLIKPTKDVNDALDLLNVRLRDSTGAIRPEIFGEIGERLQELAPAQRQFVIATLGGSDAVRAFGLAAQDGVAGFEEMNTAIVGTTAAVDLASARTQGFSGDLENLSNQATSLGTTLGQIVLPPLSLAVRGLADIARTANLAATALKDAATAASGIGQAFADQIPFLDQAESKLGGIARTAVRLQLLGPVVTIATLAMDKFGDSSANAAGDVDVLTDSLANFDREMRRTRDSLEGRGDTGGEAEPAGLNPQQILNRVAGFESAEVRARIRGNTEEILSVLEDEQAFLEQQLQSQTVKRRPALQRQLENALFGVVNDIASISSAGAADAKRAAADAARAVNEADQALLDLLGQRRDDAGRKIAAAAQTEGVRDDIRAQNQIQALIKQQIQKVRDRISDEKTRRAAIRDLRIELIASRREEDALRQQQREDAAARREEGINLDIAFAETTGNVNREIAARQRLIALLKKQQAAVKKGTNEWKRIRNEIAEQQQAIKDARGQAEQAGQDGQTAQQFFFEQLQAQQGFAANLLGNLIPLSATGGLVGVPSDNLAGGPGPGISTAASVAEGKDGRGPTAGQASTTNELLQRILQQLKGLNRAADAPEAIYQKKVGSAELTGGGGNVNVM